MIYITTFVLLAFASFTSLSVCVWSMEVETLYTLEDFELMRSRSDKMVLGLFKDSFGNSSRTFRNIAGQFDHLYFGITHEAVLFRHMKLPESEKEAILYLRRFVEEKKKVTLYNGSFVDPGSIQRFVLGHFLQPVSQLTPSSRKLLLNGTIKVNLFLFINKRRHKVEPYLSKLEPLADEWRGRILFVEVNTSGRVAGRLMDMFGVCSRDEPSIAIGSFRTPGKLIKYKPTPEAGGVRAITRRLVRSFLSDFWRDALRPYLSSQATPTDWNARPVKILTTGNFDHVVGDKSRTILVNFYFAHRCKPCRQFEPVFEKLAEQNLMRADIVFAKIDAIANEFETIDIPHFPHLILFPKYSDTMVNYSGDFSLRDVTEFLESHMGNTQIESHILGKQRRVTFTSEQRYEL